MIVRNNKFDLAKLQEARAMNKYNQLYDNALYAQAVNGKSNQYANQLINNALALCGHPHYRMSDRKWSQDAFRFLMVFSRL